MGVTLMAFNIPEYETVKTYRISVRILSANYLILSLLVFCMVFFGLRNCPDDVFPFPVLLISTSQGFIFAYALVSLYAPKNFARKKVLYYNILPLSLLIILYGVFAAFLGDPVCTSIPDFFSKLLHPTIFIRLLLLVFNIFQIVFYNSMVQKLSVRYTQYLNQYYSDTIQLKPQWAKKNFYMAVMVGLMSIISSLFKDVLIDTIFTVLFCIYYFLFAIMYMQYEEIFKKLEPEFIEDLTQRNPVQKIISGEKKFCGFNWLTAKRHIIDKKLYLQSGVTVNDMAEFFNTNRTTFSTLLNKNERQNFNSFINTLRIEHAKQLLIENPQLSIVEISQQCGYTEQSNFTRQFKLLCNETPAAWVKMQRKYTEV